MNVLWKQHGSKLDRLGCGEKWPTASLGPGDALEGQRGGVSLPQGGVGLDNRSEE